MAYVHIDLDEFDDDDLVQELEERGYTVINKNDNRTKLDKDDLDVIYKEFIGNEDQFRAYIKKLLMDNGYHP